MFDLTIGMITVFIVGVCVGVFAGAVATYLDMIKPTEEEMEKIKWKNS